MVSKKRMKPVLCEKCGKIIKIRHRGRMIQHVNIGQKKQVRTFCTHDCKHEWIFNAK